MHTARPLVAFDSHNGRFWYCTLLPKYNYIHSNMECRWGNHVYHLLMMSPAYLPHVICINYSHQLIVSNLRLQIAVYSFITHQHYSLIYAYYIFKLINFHLRYILNILYIYKVYSCTVYFIASFTYTYVFFLTIIIISCANIAYIYIMVWVKYVL